jgi:hypothetical protein
LRRYAKEYSFWQPHAHMAHMASTASQVASLNAAKSLNNERNSITSW